jgi:hypothetical protein
MTFYEKKFREIDFNNVFPTKQQQIKKHIFIKEKNNGVFQGLANIGLNDDNSFQKTGNQPNLIQPNELKKHNPQIQFNISST